MREILNVFAGVGGNRKLWKNVRVTAVEINQEVADEYQKHFPNDEVIVADAWTFILNSDLDYDFIWASPPCQTHSGSNNFLNAQGHKRYPDMRLYGLIMYLQQFHKVGQWVVENVKPYYEPLIKPKAIISRHYFWSNFSIQGNGKLTNDFSVLNAKEVSRISKATHIKLIEERLGMKVNKKLKLESNDYLQVYRNAVDPKVGLDILIQAGIQKTLDDFL